MIDAQAIASVGGVLLGVITLLGGWILWLVHDLKSQMNRNHRELLAVLQGHTHADGSPPMFSRLPSDSGN